MKSIRWAAVFSLIAASIACGEKAEEAPAVEYVPNVETMKVVPSPFDETFSLVGVAHAEKRATLSAEVGGLAVSLPVEEGQPVAKGQLLLEIEKTAYRAELEAARSAQRLAEKNRQRTAALAEKKLAGAEAVDQAETQRHQANASLALAEFRLQKTDFRAPFDGLLNRVHVESGELIAPGAPVIDIVRLDPIEIHVQIPERDLGSVRVGDRIDFSVEALGDARRQGEIVYVSAAANPSNKSYLAKIRVPNPNGEIRDGMFARTRFLKSRRSDAIAVPQNAVIDREEGHYVFVVEEGAARRRMVRLGPHDAQRVVIESGLSAGEELVRLGHRNLTDKQKVRIVNGDG